MCLFSLYGLVVVSMIAFHESYNVHSIYIDNNLTNHSCMDCTPEVAYLEVNLSIHLKIAHF